jgi:arabinose-5-phosphate isomerase
MKQQQSRNSPQPVEQQSSDTAIANARAVLNTEIKGLQALHDAVDTSFAKAVERIHAMKGNKTGRLIVAGIGKSGHIANKVAATLASTGTPAFFVHPGEASHGDMGMITEADIVLIYSNSGENSELSDLIAYTRRFGITLIGITSNGDSTLAGHSNIALVMPGVEEACPNGLAPTTSTTMMLALGDCLAVALLQRMGLTPEQYKLFHPGGKLGQRLASVADLMFRGDDLPLVQKGQYMDHALLVMTSANLGSAIVTDDDGRLAGIITDGDLKRHMDTKLLQKPVESVMSQAAKTTAPDALAAEALDIMLNRFSQPITSLVVEDEHGRVCGLIRVQECLQAGIA